MNISISSLRLYSHVKQSPFSLPLCHKRTDINFIKISANNFFYPFFRTQSKAVNTDFFQCKFRRFLNSPIFINSDRFYEMRFHDFNQFSDNSTASFKLCIFTNCFNSEAKGRGGAIFYSNTDGRLIFNQCGFDNCTSDNGGAFFARCKIYTIFSTCITHCTASDKYITFRIAGNTYKSFDLELSSMKYITLFGNGPLRILQQKTFFHMSDITILIENSNITNTKKMHKIGMMRFQERATVTHININYVNFKENDGPGLIFISQPLAIRAEDAPKIENSNFIANNPGDISLIYINDTKCLIRNSVFLQHTQKDMIYLTLTEGSHLTLHTCYVDVSLKTFKGYVQGKFKNFSSVFEAINISLWDVEAIDISECFQFAVTATFSPSMTMPGRRKRVDENGNQNNFSPTMPFTASKPLYPKTIFVQQLTLLLTVTIGIPMFYILYYMKLRQISGHPRKTKKRSQK